MNAVQTYNNPLTVFKSEAFIVLMVIAWTYLLHAYFRKHKIEYRYHKKAGTRRKFDRTKAGAFKHWELERCLNDSTCPLDTATKQNLLFLIGLRHEIEHQMALGLEAYIGSKFQACCLNYEFWLTTLFGEEYQVSSHLSLALQFVDISLAPDGNTVPSAVPANVANYIRNFESDLEEDVFRDSRYQYTMYFSRKLTNNRGTADRAIEFISAASELAYQIDREFWVKKEVERPKYRVKDIITRMRELGFPKFNQHHHTILWKERDGKNLGKGYGVDVVGTWYWYEPWIAEVERHCKENAHQYA